MSCAWWLIRPVAGAVRPSPHRVLCLWFQFRPVALAARAFAAQTSRVVPLGPTPYFFHGPVHHRVCSHAQYEGALPPSQGKSPNPSALPGLPLHHGDELSEAMAVFH